MHLPQSVHAVKLRKQRRRDAYGALPQRNCGKGALRGDRPSVQIGHTAFRLGDERIAVGECGAVDLEQGVGQIDIDKPVAIHESIVFYIADAFRDNDLGQSVTVGKSIIFYPLHSRAHGQGRQSVASAECGVADRFDAVGDIHARQIETTVKHLRRDDLGAFGQCRGSEQGAPSEHAGRRYIDAVGDDDALYTAAIKRIGCERFHTAVRRDDGAGASDLKCARLPLYDAVAGGEIDRVALRDAQRSERSTAGKSIGRNVAERRGQAHHAQFVTSRKRIALHFLNAFRDVEGDEPAGRKRVLTYRADAAEIYGCEQIAAEKCKIGEISQPLAEHRLTHIGTVLERVRSDVRHSVGDDDVPEPAAAFKRIVADIFQAFGKQHRSDVISVIALLKCAVRYARRAFRHRDRGVSRQRQFFESVQDIARKDGTVLFRRVPSRAVEGASFDVDQAVRE